MSDDPRDRFLTALKRGLRGGPLRRRRVVREIAAHLDDTVRELEARGMAEPAAVDEALRRLGDVGAITSAFHAVRPDRGRLSRVRRLRSPAWLAVGAMSLVTAWAAELPQASGASATMLAHPAVHARHLVGARDRQHHRGDDRRVSIRPVHPARR